jgi:hypothetical protein
MGRASNRKKAQRQAGPERFQCDRTHWKSGFRASGSGPIFRIKLTGIELQRHERGIPCRMIPRPGARIARNKTA